MRKLCLTLCLVFVFLSSFSVSVIATDVNTGAAGSVDVLSSTDLISLDVGDVVPRGHYVFSDDISIDLSSSYVLPVSFSNMGVTYSQVYFYVSGTSTGLSTIAYRPESRDVWRNGWLNDSYRYIFIMEPVIVTAENIEYLSLLSPYVPSTVSSFFAVFDIVSGGLIALLSTVTALFWADGSFTFFGALSILALAISISLLLFYFLLRFLKFRG